MVLLYFYSDRNLLNVLASSEVDYVLLNVMKNDNCVVVCVGGVDYIDIINALEIEVVVKKEISNRLVVEGYTRNINNYVCIDDYKINIQMSITKDTLIIGSPLIYNSF